MSRTGGGATPGSENTPAWGDIVYAAELAALNLIAPTVFTQAAGPCPSLRMSLPNGAFLQITDEDEPLAWHRSEHEGWAVAYYPDASAAQPAVTRQASEGTPQALITLVAHTITEVFVAMVQA